MIEQFIKDICKILNIRTPKISYDTSKFATKTTLVACKSDGSIIYLLPLTHTNRPTPDYMFAIAHELRHCWQYKTNKNKYFSNYQSNTELDVESYNKQLAEIDANAFGYIIMDDFFGVEAQFDGLSDEIFNMIQKRVNEIDNEM